MTLQTVNAYYNGVLNRPVHPFMMNSAPGSVAQWKTKYKDLANVTIVERL